jgi:carboxypeptidase D
MNLPIYYLVWWILAELMVVDQPVGTGYSYVDTDSFLHELPEVCSVPRD